VTALLIANAVVSLATIAFALMGGLRPSALSDSGTPTPGERFHGWMYATRGIPLGAAAALAPLLWPGPAAALLLYAAATAQLGDVIIGTAHRKWTMIAGATVVAAVHIATALLT
jgi:hypothetical protein